MEDSLVSKRWWCEILFTLSLVPARNYFVYMWSSSRKPVNVALRLRLMDEDWQTSYLPTSALSEHPLTSFFRFQRYVDKVPQYPPILNRLYIYRQ